MKKNYNQPIVEAVEVQAASMLLDASPLQNSGSGTSTIIPGTGDQIVGG